MSFVVSSVESFVVSIPFDHGAEGLKLGGQSWSAIETLLVRVTASDGTVGWGEGFGFHLCRVTQYALDSLVASHLVGREVDTPAAWTDGARRSMHNFGMNGPVTYAISALDIALWDIVGKQAGKPIHQLIGSRRTDIPTYASLMRYGTVPDVRRQVAAAVDQGYGSIKLHEIGVAEIKAARSVLTAGQPLMVDVNCAWTSDEAAGIIDQLQDAALAWLEEPTWAPNDFAAMACLKGRGVPIAAGENLSGLGDFKSLMAAKAVDIAQPSVTKVGGISEMLRVVSLCADHGIGMAPHSPYFGPGYVATAHVLAATAEPTSIECFFGTMQADIYQDRFRPANGVIALSDAPGLGADPDLSIIERYRVA